MFIIRNMTQCSIFYGANRARARLLESVDNLYLGEKMNHFGKKLCLFLVAGIGMQAAFANQVDIIFRHNPAVGPQPTQDVRLYAQVMKAHHSAGTPYSGLPVSGYSVDNVRSSLFSKDLSGIYEVLVVCFIGHQQQAKVSLYKQFPNNGSVNIDASCPVDYAGELLVPTVMVSAHNS
jgi:hypothetical protein